MNNQEKIKSSVQEEKASSESQENETQKEENQENQGKLSLVVRDKANNVETRHALEEGKEIVVGASPECSVIVSDPYISGKHFLIKVEDGKIEVKDLGSRNGLFLRLEGPSEIVPGQKLLAGKTAFTIEGVEDGLS